METKQVQESSDMFKGKTLLITGGTGSFGNAMIKGFLDSELKEIRIFSRDEKKQEDMRIEYKNEKLNFFLGDVRNFNDINQAMMGVDFVFHAAALKQVPSCEFYPMQAVQTNILGAENVLEAAARNNVQRVVVLSTDKAVYPINTMGMSKALMEKLAVSKARDTRVQNIDAVYTATRYGNVMCSRGSIIPLFINIPPVFNTTPVTFCVPLPVVVINPLFVPVAWSSMYIPIVPDWFRFIVPLFVAWELAPLAYIPTPWVPDTFITPVELFSIDELSAAIAIP